MPRPAWAAGSPSGVSACSDGLDSRFSRTCPRGELVYLSQSPRQPQDLGGRPAGPLGLTACPADPQAARPGGASYVRGYTVRRRRPPPLAPRAAAGPPGQLCSGPCAAREQVRGAAGCHEQGGAHAGREHKAAVRGDQRQDGRGQQRRQGHRARPAAVGVCVCAAASSYICMCAERARRPPGTRAGRPGRRARVAPVQCAGPARRAICPSRSWWHSNRVC